MRGRAVRVTRPEAFREDRCWLDICESLKRVGLDMDDEFELKSMMIEWADQRVRRKQEDIMIRRGDRLGA